MPWRNALLMLLLCILLGVVSVVAFVEVFRPRDKLFRPEGTWAVDAGVGGVVSVERSFVEDYYWLEAWEPLSTQLVTLDADGWTRLMKESCRGGARIDGYTPHEGLRCDGTLREMGWPLRCFDSVYALRFPAQPGANYGAFFIERDDGSRFLRIPGRIVWLPFMVNSTLFAAGWFVVMFGTVGLCRRARRRRRRTAGACLACGHPLMPGDARCLECGV